MQQKEAWLERISSDPDILHGKPCIKGTRIPVYLIVAMVADGQSYDEILKSYPSLHREDIVAALRYAARMTEYEAYAL
jgi:uncharacterized protein (DUF433 family)